MGKLPANVLPKTLSKKRVSHEHMHHSLLLLTFVTSYMDFNLLRTKDDIKLSALLCFAVLSLCIHNLPAVEEESAIIENCIN